MPVSGHAAPLAVQTIYDALHQRLDAGDYAVGDRLPTEREIGEEFGVSRMTVAKAMAQLVCEGRVERFRGRGTFATAGPAADAPSGVGTATAVSFISPGRTGQPVQVSHGILEGMHAVLRAAGYTVGVEFYDGSEAHRQCLAEVQRPTLAGAAVWPEPGPGVGEAITTLRQTVPVVLVDTYLPELDCDHVVSDNLSGASLMVDHLAASGHRRIVYLTEPPDRTSTRDRLTGFFRGMVVNGLPLRADSVTMCIPMPGRTCRG